MFEGFCPRCGPVLIWESLILDLENTRHGILVRYRCRCGTECELATGRGLEHAHADRRSGGQTEYARVNGDDRDHRGRPPGVHGDPRR